MPARRASGCAPRCTRWDPAWSPIDPIKALFYSALVNGIVSVPIKLLLVLLASNRAALGRLRLSGTAHVLAWAAALLVTAAVGFMLVTQLRA